MDNTKNDDYYLEKMKNNFDRILKVMDKVTFDEYTENIDLQDITMFNLIQISENAKNISVEFKEKNQDVSWTDIYGLRNRIVHDYGNVLLDIIYDTLSNDIPKLYEKLYK